MDASGMSSGHGFSHADKTCRLERALAPEGCPSAAKAGPPLALLAARLKSCPDDLHLHEKCSSWIARSQSPFDFAHGSTTGAIRCWRPIAGRIDGCVPMDKAQSDARLSFGEGQASG